jgi:hypothetical protein
MIEMTEEKYITEALVGRWLSILRAKASEYEHPARRENEVVSSPSIDDICNEMVAYFTGIRGS